METDGQEDRHGEAHKHIIGTVVASSRKNLFYTIIRIDAKFGLSL